MFRFRWALNFQFLTRFYPKNVIRFYFSTFFKNISYRFHFLSFSTSPYKIPYSFPFQHIFSIFMRPYLTDSSFFFIFNFFFPFSTSTRSPNSRNTPSHNSITNWSLIVMKFCLFFAHTDSVEATQFEQNCVSACWAKNRQLVGLLCSVISCFHGVSVE